MKEAWRAAFLREALDETTRRLIVQARIDLYEGPDANADDEDNPETRYPGFCRAVKRIREALRETLPASLYFDTESETWHEEIFPDDACELHYELDRSELVRILVGRELAEYIR
jgi:hypothetical protein